VVEAVIAPGVRLLASVIKPTSSSLLLEPTVPSLSIKMFAPGVLVSVTVLILIVEFGSLQVTSIEPAAPFKAVTLLA